MAFLRVVGRIGVAFLARFTSRLLRSDCATEATTAAEGGSFRVDRRSGQAETGCQGRHRAEL